MSQSWLRAPKGLFFVPCEPLEFGRGDLEVSTSPSFSPWDILGYAWNPHPHKNWCVCVCVFRSLYMGSRAEPPQSIALEDACAIGTRTDETAGLTAGAGRLGFVSYSHGLGPCSGSKIEGQLICLGCWSLLANHVGCQRKSKTSQHTARPASRECVWLRCTATCLSPARPAAALLGWKTAVPLQSRGLGVLQVYLELGRWYSILAFSSCTQTHAEHI